MIVLLYKGKGERGQNVAIRGIYLFSVIGKIFAGILVDRVCKVTECLLDDKKGGFRAGRGCVDQIFTLKQISEKVWEKRLEFM